MMQTYTSITVSFLTLLTMASCSPAQERPDSENMLWYDEPAQAWEETLPLGNGRLGMMPDGGIAKETFILKEIRMWGGCETD